MTRSNTNYRTALVAPTALSQNGYVSHYWYDANGERTVKMHGGNMAVFVNSCQDAPVGRGASRAVREEIQ